LRIIVACGGTAGHFLPALSFLGALKAKRDDLDLCVVVTKRKIEKEAEFSNYRVLHLSLVPVSTSINFKNLIAVLKFFAGCLESLYILLKVNPDVVVGFGGYASFPLVFFASLLRKKTVIHEQNVSPGVSNKLLALFADRVAVSFPESLRRFKTDNGKVIFTGNPVRKDLSKVGKKEALGYFGLSERKFTLLVMGGSQGSRRINMAVVGAFSSIQIAPPEGGNLITLP